MTFGSKLLRTVLPNPPPPPPSKTQQTVWVMSARTYKNVKEIISIGESIVLFLRGSWTFIYALLPQKIAAFL